MEVRPEETHITRQTRGDKQHSSDLGDGSGDHAALLIRGVVAARDGVCLASPWEVSPRG
jgi:hypothetical protein